MPLTRPKSAAVADSAAPQSFHPDPELSEQISQMAERALTRVAIDGAVLGARARITDLEGEVAQLRAEAQWREAGWVEERTELLVRVHNAQLETTAERARLEQSQFDVLELEDEMQCARTALEATRTALTTMTVQSDTRLEQIQSIEEEVVQLREQLLERERVLGAMWQTLQEYRSQGPIHRLLRRPGLPDATATLLISTDETA